MQVSARRNWCFTLSAIALAALLLASAGGCTLHRNLLLRWHIEFDADCIQDGEVPCSADDCCRCGKCSRLGRAEREMIAPAPGLTPNQTGHARFHPVPSKPVFPEPDGSDMADMGPPAPQWYERQHQPLEEKGRIEAEPAIPAPDLEEVQRPLPPMPESGWDVNGS